MSASAVLDTPDVVWPTPRPTWLLLTGLLLLLPPGLGTTLRACGDPLDDHESLKVRVGPLTPSPRPALNLASAVVGEVPLRLSVQLLLQGDNEPLDWTCSGREDDQTFAFVRWPGVPPNTALTAAGQTVPLRGLRLEPDPEQAVTCEGRTGRASGTITVTFAYRLVVTDANALAAQATGPLDLQLAPEVCFYRARGQGFVPPPEQGTPGCGVPVRFPVEVVSVPAQTTELRLTREGQGRVTSSVPGLDCGTTCTARFPPGTSLTLTAVADPGWRFDGFTGDADCQDGSLRIDLTTVRCTATFTEVGLQWQSVGDALNLGAIPSDASGPALALDAANRAVVAWAESPHLYVKRWTGAAWEQLGGALELGTNGTGEPSLALDAAGRPWVAWDEQAEASSPSRNVYVKRWDGAAWQLVGGAALDTEQTRDASQPCLVVHAGRPVVAWVEELGGATGSGVLVRAWDGSAWVNAASTPGPVVAPGAESAVPRLASTPTVLFVAWLDGLTQVRLEQLPDGITQWQPRASLPVSVASVPAVALAWSPTQELLLAVQPTGAAARSFTVQRWRNDAWSTLGGPLGRVESTARISGLSLSGGSPTRQPVVAWSERNGAVHRFVVRRWSVTGAWLEEGQPLPATGRAGPGVEGAVVVVDGLRPTLVSTVSTQVTAGSADVSVLVRELR